MRNRAVVPSSETYGITDGEGSRAAIMKMRHEQWDQEERVKCLPIVGVRRPGR